ncbi:nucleolar zinc-finger protein [Malassezia sp. CBS 17886]|nr:nucleolar zinc-finger protein [Malassezia sp. CBS 17886]
MANDPHFRPIGEHVEGPIGDEENEALVRGVEEIESLCMQCEKQGTTRLLPTYIPYFREVIVMSFSCPHCGNRNSEIQSAGEIHPKGCVYTAHITMPSDLDRQLIKSEFATVTVPELEQLQIPPKRGQITTIEGVLDGTLRDLEFEQPLRKHTQPDAYAKIEELCKKLRAVVSSREAGAEGSFRPFRVSLDDPSGNSFIEYRGTIESSGASDARWSKRDYPRTKEQNEMLGLAPDAGATAEGQAGGGLGKEDGETDFENEEIFSFDGTCSSCNAPTQTKMKKVNIPYFKVHCGYRDNEVKSGAAISPEGRKLTLKVLDGEDLTRDVLKSETAGMSIPEIDLYLAPGTLGGRFTTLEGLLQTVYDELYEKVFMHGDSTTGKDVATFESFLGKLKRAISAELCPYTLILDDPLANSYIQNPYAPDADEQLTVENYPRSFEQNDELGLNDMLVEGYEDPSSGAQGGVAVAGEASPGTGDA